MAEIVFMLDLPEAKAQQFQGHLMMVTPLTPVEKEELRQLLLSSPTESGFNRIRELIGRAIFVGQVIGSRRMN